MLKNRSAPAAARVRFAPFAYGFRPFFLAAGVYGALALVAWLALFHRGLAPFGELPTMYWHAHEMLFGFVTAAIAGFMLTAVPSWTGSPGFAGAPLVAVFAIWIAGRAALALTGALPWLAVAAVELAFIPALIVLLAPPLLRARNANTPLLLVLVAFWSADAAFLYGLQVQDLALLRGALYFGIHLVLLLVTVIGGRIVPAFTANALRRRGVAVSIRRSPWLERLTIASMLLVVVLELVAPRSTVAAAVAGVAAVAHLARLAGWQGQSTLRDPLVWVLHAAYAWLPLGLALKALSLSTGAPWASHWLHALTIGSAALMILAVMTRASLGHTGRPLAASGVTAGAYGMLMLAALVRVFGPSVLPGSYTATALGAGLLWLAAFGGFVAVYAPVLLRARADGKPG
jgi:uncharacterized protein involved in response to NO